MKSASVYALMPVSCGVMLAGIGSSGGAPGIGPPLSVVPWQPLHSSRC